MAKNYPCERCGKFLCQCHKPKVAISDIAVKLVEESDHHGGATAELLEGAASEIDLLRDEKVTLKAELGRVRAERDELETECKERVAEKMEWLTERNGMQKENAWLRSAIGDNAAAYQKGREDMRDEAAILAASLFAGCSLDIRGAGYDISTAIRAIPTDGREGK